MHRSALMELGLVLFLITFILNGLARLLIVATERGGGRPVMNDIRLMWRKSLNGVMLTLTGVAAFGVVAVLFLILGYLVWNGGTSLNWAFFTQLPKGEGETGGGMANAIVGSLKLLFLAAVIGLAGRLDGRRLPGRIRRQDLLVHHALYDGSSERRALHRHRLVCLLVAVVPVKHFSALAGGIALAIMVIPDHGPQH